MSESTDKTASLSIRAPEDESHFENTLTERTPPKRATLAKCAWWAFAAAGGAIALLLAHALADALRGDGRANAMLPPERAPQGTRASPPSRMIPAAALEAALGIPPGAESHPTHRLMYHARRDGRALALRGVAALLFVPGHGGAADQAGRLGVAIRERYVRVCTACAPDTPAACVDAPLDVFAVDTGGEPTALSGRFVADQAAHVAASVGRILRMSPGAKHVVLAGHSMGGVVIAHMLATPAGRALAAAGAVRVALTVASPLARPVVLFDWRMHAVYAGTAGLLRGTAPLPGGADVSLVALLTGPRDMQVDARGCLVGPRDGPSGGALPEATDDKGTAALRRDAPAAQRARFAAQSAWLPSADGVWAAPDHNSALGSEVVARLVADVVHSAFCIADGAVTLRPTNTDRLAAAAALLDGQRPADSGALLPASHQSIDALDSRQQDTLEIAGEGVHSVPAATRHVAVRVSGHFAIHTDAPVVRVSFAGKENMMHTDVSAGKEKMTHTDVFVGRETLLDTDVSASKDKMIHTDVSVGRNIVGLDSDVSVGRDKMMHVSVSRSPANVPYAMHGERVLSTLTLVTGECVQGSSATLVLALADNVASLRDRYILYPTEQRAAFVRVVHRAPSIHVLPPCTPPLWTPLRLPALRTGDTLRLGLPASWLAYTLSFADQTPLRAIVAVGSIGAKETLFFDARPQMLVRMQDDRALGLAITLVRTDDAPDTPATLSLAVHWPSTLLLWACRCMLLALPALFAIAVDASVAHWLSPGWPYTAQHTISTVRVATLALILDTAALVTRSTLLLGTPYGASALCVIAVGLLAAAALSAAMPLVALCRRVSQSSVRILTLPKITEYMPLNSATGEEKRRSLLFHAGALAASLAALAVPAAAYTLLIAIIALRSCAPALAPAVLLLAVQHAVALPAALSMLRAHRYTALLAETVLSSVQLAPISLLMHALARQRPAQDAPSASRKEHHESFRGLCPTDPIDRVAVTASAATLVFAALRFGVERMFVVHTLASAASFVLLVLCVHRPRLLVLFHQRRTQSLPSPV